MIAYHGIRPVFDDPNLVSAAGVVPLLALAESAGLSDLIDEHCTLAAPALPAKARTVIAGMAAGADSIEGLDRLRAGGNDQVLQGVRAPSTIGTFLRSVTAGGFIEQFLKVNRLLLKGLAARVRGLVGGGETVFIDIDDTIREVHGHKKGGAGFGYTGVRGLNAMITTASTASSAPVVVEASLRKGSTSSGKGSARQIGRALSASSGLVGPGQRQWVRADSAFCNAANVASAARAGAWYSFTAKMWPNVKAAIATISQDAWTAIKYPNAVTDPDTGDLISEAEVAEAPFTAFASSKPKRLQAECRLVVRRVVRKNKALPAGQGELFDDYRYHAFITNVPFSAVDADKAHRGHAIIEQTISELKNGPLAHLPSGNFHANALWLALAVITFNLMRAAAHAALKPQARYTTVKDTIINVPARMARRGRQTILHLPTYWPWAYGWENLWNIATGPPAKTA